MLTKIKKIASRIDVLHKPSNDIVGFAPSWKARKSKILKRKIANMFAKMKKKTAGLNTSPYSFTNITAATLVPPVIIAVLLVTNAKGIITGLMSGDAAVSSLTISAITSILLATTSLALFNEIKRSQEADEKTLKIIDKLQKQLAAVDRRSQNNTDTLETMADAHHRSLSASFEGWTEILNDQVLWDKHMPNTAMTSVGGILRFDLVDERNSKGELVLVPNLDRLSVQMKRCLSGSALKKWNLINISRKDKDDNIPPSNMLRQIAAFQVMREAARRNNLNFDTSNVAFYVCAADQDISEACFVYEQDHGTGHGHGCVIRYVTTMVGAPSVFLEKDVLVSKKPATFDRYSEWTLNLMNSEGVRKFTLEEAEAWCADHMPHVAMPDNMNLPSIQPKHDAIVCFDDHFSGF